MSQSRQNSRRSPRGLCLTVMTASAELDEQGSSDFIVPSINNNVRAALMQARPPPAAAQTVYTIH